MLSGMGFDEYQQELVKRYELPEDAAATAREIYETVAGKYEGTSADSFELGDLVAETVRIYEESDPDELPYETAQDAVEEICEAEATAREELEEGDNFATRRYRGARKGFYEGRGLASTMKISADGEYVFETSEIQ